MIIKRVERGEEADLRHLYDKVVQEVQQFVASGEYSISDQAIRAIASQVSP
jgi:hypothetical protein